MHTTGDLGNADENVENLCWGTAGDNDESSSFKDSIVGRVVGGADNIRQEEEDAQEPLALLVVHAAMHMLFLPQFTCEFFEESNDPNARAEINADSDSSSVESMDSEEREEKRAAQKKNNADEEMDEEKKIEQQIEEQGDIFMRKEAGLKETRYAENGIILLPRPTTIVWAGGIGVKTTKVCIKHEMTAITV